MPTMCGFHSQALRGSAMSDARSSEPSTGVFAATARRGIPRITWIPSFRPSAWISSASGPNPAPSPALGKRTGSGITRPCSSITSGAPWL